MKFKYNGQWVDVNIKALDSMVIGSIIQFVGTTIPNGWLECDGSTITQSAYPELYDLIGGTLPDFRGRVLVGQNTNDTDFDTLLETGGSKELQQHSHSLNVYATGSGTTTGTQVTTTGALFQTTTTYTAGTGDSGNLQPYAVVKHIIKAKNTTPTMASVVNTTNNSTEDAYSCDYVNGDVLYDDTTGTQGNIPLPDISGYRYLEIFGYDNIFYQHIYTKWSTDSGRYISIEHLATNGSQMRFQCCRYQINTNGLNPESSQQVVIFNRGINEQSSNNEFYITKVIGYK